MGVYIVFAENVSNERAFMLWVLCQNLQIDYYSEYTDENKTAQYCAVGPVSEGDKNQVCDCLDGCAFVVMEAQEHETV